MLVSLVNGLLLCHATNADAANGQHATFGPPGKVIGCHCVPVHPATCLRDLLQEPYGGFPK